LKGGEILALSGDLGSGKTVFTKGLALQLGIKETITSPTFILMKIYPLPSGLSFRYLAHFDLYRLKEKEINYQEFTDYLGKEDGVCVIEWAEKIKKYLKRFGNKVIWIQFQHLHLDKRKIIIKRQSK